ncbi:hypothetical protein EV385_1886 [Krasilnikovia cinnamomea]|uniref:Uncharacterized protein n=1 Tax=Krasilnikovia cinnamomea TaxID=349313 RepID=A0A4Q7ZI80_9ACTN|nr:hypothetical protein [Krasilnikovia cinnamomea]RZU50121.1 hypothetical protein EV385_1886 [Krasilnikovia cinnamomea]
MAGTIKSAEETIRSHPWTAGSAIIGALALVVAVLAYVNDLAGDADASEKDAVAACAPVQMIEAGDSSTRLRPPGQVFVEWTRSPTLAGRVSASVRWVDNDPRTSFGLLEVTGRYGVSHRDDTPVRLDGRALPSPGICGHWYRRYNDKDDGERGVFFDGLWADEPYCFSPNSSAEWTGVNKAPFPSVGAPPKCETAPWNDGWGSADRPGVPRDTTE